MKLGNTRREQYPKENLRMCSKYFHTHIITQSQEWYLILRNRLLSQDPLLRLLTKEELSRFLIIEIISEPPDFKQLSQSEGLLKR